MMEKSIGWFDSVEGVYGAAIYNKMAQDILSKYFNLDVIDIGSGSRITGYPRMVYNIYKLSEKLSKERDVLIRGFHGVIAMLHKHQEVKDVAILHHMPFRSKHLQAIGLLLEKVYHHNLKKADAIVTVSKYWQNYFLEKGYSNVHVIYNAFDLKQFDISEAEVLEFKKRFNLDEKPIIYIGNCRRKKGIIEVYRQLKNLKAHFITSGEPEAKIPAINLNLTYRDYLCLLKASHVVVTMSTYREGWNRTAHEAMLCKTPVVGSGLGGMGELLEGGGQIICKSFNSLKATLEYLMENSEIRKKIGERGYEFAKEFTIEGFEKQWVEFITKGL